MADYDAAVSAAEKRCTGCGNSYPDEGFSKDKTRSSGRTERCRGCRSAAHKEWRTRFPYKQKWIRIKLLYGMTEADYEEILQEQQQRCAICREELQTGKSTHIDHCHKTGRVRGILCNGCNVALGYIKEDISLLRRIEEYLQRQPTGFTADVCKIADYGKRRTPARRRSRG